VTAGTPAHEGLSRHSHNKEIEVLKKTCINAGLVAAVAGTVLLGAGSAANADWGGGCCGGDHNSNFHHSKNKNKNNNRINIRIRVRNNNFNDNEERRREFRHERFRDREFDHDRDHDRDHDHGHGHGWGEERGPIIIGAPAAVPAVG